MTATILAAVALAVALAAMGAAVAVMRQSGEALALIRAHRLAHTDAYGTPDPRLDRRQVNLGPPRREGERRGAHRYAPPEHVQPRDEPRLLPGALIPTDEQVRQAMTDWPDPDPEYATLPNGVRVPVDPDTTKITDDAGRTVWTRSANPYAELARNARDAGLDGLAAAADDAATTEHAPPTAELGAIKRPRPRPRP